MLRSMPCSAHVSAYGVLKYAGIFAEVSTTVLVASPRGVGPKSVTKPKKRAAATKSKAAMLKTKSVTPVRSSTRKAKRPAQAAA